ncbi:MAG: hydroxylamine oxidase, partial [Candidatus Zixiibacteriota bacterium]
MKNLCFILLIIFAINTLITPVTASGDEPLQEKVRLSDETQSCITCHETINPGIVGDWLTSRHAKINPKDALEKINTKKRVSS